MNLHEFQAFCATLIWTGLLIMFICGSAMIAQYIFGG